MQQRESDHRHGGAAARRAEQGRAAVDEVRPADAVRLQRLVGNRALAGVLGAAARADGVRARPISALVQRAVPTDTAPAAPATDEQALVRQWSAEAGANENTLTDRLYFRRHPESQGVALKPGTPGAAEWIEIRETVVRPALATPRPPEQSPEGEPAQPASGAPGESTGDGSGAGDLLRNAAQAGVDLIDWAVETGGGMIDAVAGFLGVDREVVDAGDVQEPVIVVDVPQEPGPPEESAAPAHQRGDAFKDQRDNKSAHVSGGASCSPTSFTMALIDLHGGDEAAVRGRTIELVKERGGNTGLAQTEELVIELLQVVDWPKATAEKPAYFWEPKKWAEWAKNKYKGRYYKDPNAQQYVASLYSATSGKAAETYNAETREGWAPVIAALADGAVATAEGAFTEDGHVVNIVNADDSGVTINDPFGLWLKGYGYQIMNGEATVPKLGATDRATLERRATTNPELVQAYDGFHSTSPPADAGFAAWGQRNFYSWDDVAKVKLGKWISVLRGR